MSDFKIICMKSSAKTDFAILITFAVGIISIVYFIAIVFLMNSDPTLGGVPESYLSWMMIERLVLIGIIIVVLILITYILMKQKGIEKLRAEMPAKRERHAVTVKELKAEIMRYYRDLGALKIVMKDKVLDSEIYEKRKKFIEDMVKKKKKQLQDLKK